MFPYLSCLSANIFHELNSVIVVPIRFLLPPADRAERAGGEIHPVHPDQDTLAEIEIRIIRQQDAEAELIHMQTGIPMIAGSGK